MSLSSSIIDWLKNEFYGGEYKPKEWTCYQRGAFYTLLGITLSIILLCLLHDAILQCPLWLKILLGSLPWQLCGIGCALYGLKGIQWHSAPSDRQITARMLLKKLWVCMLLVLLCNGIMYGICHCLGIPFIQQKLAQIISANKTLPILLTIGLLATVMAPLAEELVFRIVLYRYLRRLGDGYAVIFTSLLFAMFHRQWHLVPALFCVGCMLQHTCNHYGYKGSVLLHSLFNLVGFLAIACH